MMQRIIVLADRSKFDFTGVSCAEFALIDHLFADKIPAGIRKDRLWENNIDILSK